MEKTLAQRLREEFDLTGPMAAWIVFTHIFVLGSPLALIWAVYRYGDLLPNPMPYPVMILVATAIYIGATAFEVAQNSADRWYLTEATLSVADLFFNSFMTFAFCLYTIGFYPNPWLAAVTIVFTVAYPFAYIKEHPSARGLSGTVILLACVSVYLFTGDPAAFLFMLGNMLGVFFILFLVKRHAQWMHGWGAFFFGLGFLGWPFAIVNSANGTQLGWPVVIVAFAVTALILGALRPLANRAKATPRQFG
jgi:hypothetical protein